MNLEHMKVFLMKFIYGEDFSSGFSRYVNNKNSK